MNARYSRQYYSTPHFAPLEPSPTIFGEKPHALPRTTRAHIRFANRCRNRPSDSRDIGLASALESRGTSARYDTTGTYKQIGFDSGKNRALDAPGSSKTTRERYC
jgi:hypothetical protein